MRFTSEITRKKYNKFMLLEFVKYELALMVVLGVGNLVFYFAMDSTMNLVALVFFILVFPISLFIRLTRNFASTIKKDGVYQVVFDDYLYFVDDYDELEEPVQEIDYSNIRQIVVFDNYMKIVIKATSMYYVDIESLDRETLKNLKLKINESNIKLKWKNKKI